MARKQNLGLNPGLPGSWGCKGMMGILHQRPSGKGGSPTSLEDVDTILVLACQDDDRPIDPRGLLHSGQSQGAP